MFQDETLAAIIDLQSGVVVDKGALKVDSLRVRPEYQEPKKRRVLELKTANYLRIISINCVLKYIKESKE